MSAKTKRELWTCRECGTEYLAEADHCPNGCVACIHCGCTQYNACPGGCAWVSEDPPVCDQCAHLVAVEAG